MLLVLIPLVYSAGIYIVLNACKKLQNVHFCIIHYFIDRLSYYKSVDIVLKNGHHTVLGGG